MNGQLYPTRTIIFMSDNDIEDFIHSCQIVAIGKPIATRVWRQPVYDLINDIFRALEPTIIPTSRIILKKDELVTEADIVSPSVWKMSWFVEGILMNALLTFKGKQIYVQSVWDSELSFKVTVDDAGRFIIK